MNNWKEDIPWDAVIPFVFVLVAGGLSMLIPEAADKSKALFLVIGAALTRVRIGKK